jgi:hypothetical protein
MLYIAHWSDNRSKLGEPVKATKENSGFGLPFVYLHANGISSARRIVHDFNNEWDNNNGKMSSGFNPAHIPLGLMAKHGILRGKT